MYRMIKIKVSQITFEAPQSNVNCHSQILICEVGYCIE